MRVSVTWLGEWLGRVLDARDLAARLTMAGLEVEAVEPAAPPLPGVVVGEVIECGRHPKADSLSLCKVHAGAEVVQVVCGAPNVRAGMKAPLATIGATLPGGMEIRKAKLRGVESSACSVWGVGLFEDASGLMELPADLVTGIATYRVCRGRHYPRSTRRRTAATA
jgi:phenylalanyl-tRNA synthetase beta chain